MKGTLIKEYVEEYIGPGNSLVVQWLELHAFPVQGLGLIPGQGAKIPQSLWHSQKKKKEYTGLDHCLYVVTRLEIAKMDFNQRWIKKKKKWWYQRT